jgi:unsaturated rhamnogalacturonyl hydrolase
MAKALTRYFANSLPVASLLVLPLLTLSLLGCNSGHDPKSASQTSAQKAVDNHVASIELSNPSSFARKQQPLHLSLYDLGLKSDDSRVQELAVRVEGSYVPSQLIDRDGDGQDDSLFALVDMPAGETLDIAVELSADVNVKSKKLTQAEISKKVGGQWRPRENNSELQEYVGGKFQNVESLTPPPQHTDHSYYIRYEGPGIESDKVGYRIYLDERNGFDIFGKRTDDMVLQNVGQDGFGSYHEMADWGMDILKVGSSLGAGGYGYWTGKSVQLVSDVDGWDAHIVENGDLYSATKIVYKDWQVADKTLDLTANLSMHGGSRLVHTRLDLSEDLPNMAVGLVKHAGTELIQGDIDITGKAYTYIASWGKQSLNDDHLGMAVLFRKGDHDKVTTDDSNYVVVMDAAGQDLDYYFLAAWENESNGIKTKEDFIAYLEKEVEKLTLAPRQRMKTALSQQAKDLPASAKEALYWTKKLADSELERKALGYRYGGWDVNRERDPKFEYDIVGLLPLAYDELAKVSPQQKYEEVIYKVTASYVTEDGEIRKYKASNYNIDSVAPARNLLRLYAETGNKKYKIAAGHVREQLEFHPRTSEGAFWHKKKYEWQLWLDGVYMGMPFLTRYSKMFENGASYDEVVKEFMITRKYLRDPETGLYYHAWDEKKQQDWADPETGLSKYYWGRGFGWLTMALVDVLDYIPESETEYRQPLIDMIQEIAPALVEYQDPETGTWWQIMDMPEAPGNYRESSATSMFTYFFAKAINNGYLPESYRPVAGKAYNGLISEFITVHPDGNVSLTNICLVAGLGFGRDGSYHYYMSEPVYENDPKGTGPFILAGVEMYKLLNND